MLEIFTMSMGLIQSLLIMMKKKENWIFYMLNISALTIFSFYNHLYGDVFENLVYTFFGILGLFTWYSEKFANKIFKNSQIRHCSDKEIVGYTILLGVVSIIGYIWLIQTNDPSPFLDALTTGMGLVATIMMAFKLVESWVIWFIDDILMAYIYFSLPNPAFYLMALNIVWIGLAVITWYTWDEEAKVKCERV